MSMAVERKDVRLDRVLEAIQDGSQKARAEGLKDLRNIFDRKFKTVNIDILSDKAYHKIYEIVFRATLSEKQAFLHAKKSTHSAALARLTACSGVLRVVVKAGASRLKTKTVEAVIDHITQTLPRPDGEYCAPITQHYLQALSSVVDHQANVERMKQQTWLEVVGFCLHGITTYVDAIDEHSRQSSISSTPRNTNFSSNGHAHCQAGPVSRHNVEDLLQTLQSLVSVPNAPILEKYENIACLILRLLRVEASTLSLMHQMAFSTLNNVLLFIHADRTMFVQSIAADAVPVISRLWQGKSLAKDEMSNVVRDEMVKFLFAVHLHLARLMREGDSLHLRSEVQEALEVLRTDYSRRMDRDQLQLDDVEMNDIGGDSLDCPFNLNVFRLRPYRYLAERHWAHLQAIALLEHLWTIGNHQDLIQKSADNDLAEHPRKRQRLPDRYDRVSHYLTGLDENTRLAGLQMLPFVLQECELSSVVLSRVIEKLTSCATDKRGNVFSWTLLALASCLYQQSASELTALELHQLWQIGARALTFPITCRSAAALLHLILAKDFLRYQDVAEDVNAMINAADITGPVILCDSSLLWMMHLLHVNTTEAPASSLTACNQVVRWLLTKWNPADKISNVRYATTIQPHQIIALLRTSLGLPRLPSLSSTKLPWGSIVQAWQQHLMSQDLLRYLLLLDPAPLRPSKRLCSTCPRIAGHDEVIFTLDSTQFQSVRRLIFELLLPKLEDTLQSWKTLILDRSAQVSLDMYGTGIHMCIVSLSLLPHFAHEMVPQYQVIESNTMALNDILLDYLQNFEERDVKGSRSIIEYLLDSIHSYLPAVRATELTRFSRDCPNLLQFFVLISDAVVRRRQAFLGVPDDTKQDLMNVDDDFTTQRSQTTSDIQKIALPRHDSDLETSSALFYFTMSGRLLLIKAMSEATECAAIVPSGFVDQMLSMEDEEVLSCRGLLHEMFQSDLVFNEEDAARLIIRLGSLLSTLDYAHCELSLGICLDALNGLEHLWSSSDRSSIAEAALQLYEWFINVAIKIASPAAQMGIVRLLLLLLRTEPEYGQALGLPSPRTSLYEILQKGNVPVKFYIGQRLPDIFNLFTLKQHDDVFVDMLEALPADGEAIEGIALRMFVLSRLASTWSTLLRRCVYHIFEVPGRIRNSVHHATRCIRDISTMLGLDGPKALFVLFEPQILYTWLEHEPIEDIPYQIFGFADLEKLMICAKEEISALMLMRGQEGAIQRLAQYLHISEEQLMRDTFTKATAYAIGYDLSNPTPSSNQKRITGEIRLKRCLGTERYVESVRSHFADIISILYCLLDYDDDIESRFSKEESLKYAGDVLRIIKQTCSSEVTLPPNQQPAFRARYFTREIQHLCSRTEYKPADMYTPALVIFVARKLLNTIHPALGSLHACSVLRKVRVLIALAGHTATNGYPLEMLLHTIRPFIADSECADDAIGIIQYLLHNGATHLVQAPSFVAGISMSIMGSLRTFLRSTQASTTQDIQFKATKSKARKFHVWIGKYADEYDWSRNLKSKAASNFRSMLKSAHSIGSLGNAELGTAESQLLAQLLEDEISNDPLLNSSSRKLAHGMLCSKFQCPPSFREDIYGQDQAAMKYSSAVWRSCKGDHVSKEYLAWAARVLGRSFAASGQIHKDLLQESRLSKVKSAGLPPESDARSKSSILKLLHALTLGDDRKVVGLAEASLRLILSAADEHLMEICQATLPYHICTASIWAPLQISPSDLLSSTSIPEAAGNTWSPDAIYTEPWIRKILLAITHSVPHGPFLHALRPILSQVSEFADKSFAYIIHIGLLAQPDAQSLLKKKISIAFQQWLGNHNKAKKDQLKILVNAILYLRTQAVPGENDSGSKVTKADRSCWLDIDFSTAAAAAIKCGMFKTALLFIEQYAATPMPIRSARRSSVKLGGELPTVSSDILLTIFENIDDPDMYYGIKQDANFKTLLARLEHEKDGAKSLAFRGAQYDSHIRRNKAEAEQDSHALLKTLNVLSLSGLSRSLFQSQHTVNVNCTSLSTMFQTARKLEQWDLPVPSESNDNSITLYKTLQTIQSASTKPRIVQALNDGLESIMSRLICEDLSAHALHESLQTLAALTEMDEVFVTSSSEQFEQILSLFQGRAEWMKSGRFEDVSEILSCRGTMLSTISQQTRLQHHLHVGLNDARLVEIEAGLLSCVLSRAHNNLQESLSMATTLTDQIASCLEVGLSVEAAIHLEAANAWWDQGEITASIGMLQMLSFKNDLQTQTIPVGRSNLLSKLGHQVSVARLEKADGILEKYLKPALKELNGKATGNEASEVFHQFAMFCDQQLQDPDGLEDLQRLENLTQMKQEEVEELEKMRRQATNSAEKQKTAHHLSRARQWLNLDKQELQRQQVIRDEFLVQSLDNYLLALSASDKYSTDSLRFTALWLEHSSEISTNRAVSKYLSEVPSRRFAPLMNQLTSRLLDNDSDFQKLLFALVLRICTEHPYHGMYQIYAGVRSAINAKDDIAVSRKFAAKKISGELQNSGNNAKIWQRISGSNDLYCILAGEKSDKYKQNRRISFKDSVAATNLNKCLPKWPIPPPTMQIPLASNMDYSKVPRMIKYEPQISIASGVSAPKIITGVASNGERFRQLVKGGNDDLRQDAIMEQVFGEVSELLKSNRTTRQRHLSIRTYKVLPLTSTAGIIEFVPNTIPLHEYLMPAHERYYPNDIKASQCRKEISEVQSSSIETRLKRFRGVTDRFHPVMHLFFIEKFDDPDEWFVNRLAYTRSTSANSILGHVLGLGDRHGHNILLDSGSGEVVHIDLGIAFEMGRVLPVPELVPFRLTRDIIDGMGITKTEGVFRRCCEYTLEALRKEVYSIMTILDVLRYDPLYSWSISPVRLAKMQEAQSAAPEVTTAGATDGVPSKDKKETVNQPSEANRALTVVNKKLSKTLSVTATVNDLINQATDERNLAALFSGWAAYA